MPTATVEHVRATTPRDWIADPDQHTVIDVRSPVESETAHITGSYNVPLGLVDEHADQRAARLDREVVSVCQSGERARSRRGHGTLPGTRCLVLAAAAESDSTTSAITNTCATARILALLRHNRDLCNPDGGGFLDVFPQRRTA